MTVIWATSFESSCGAPVSGVLIIDGTMANVWKVVGLPPIVSNSIYVSVDSSVHIAQGDAAQASALLISASFLFLAIPLRRRRQFQYQLYSPRFLIISGFAK